MICSQMLLNIKSKRRIGDYLFRELTQLMKKLHLGETYILGDSPLVLLSALQTTFERDRHQAIISYRLFPK